MVTGKGFGIRRWEPVVTCNRENFGLCRPLFLLALLASRDYFKLIIFHQILTWYTFVTYFWPLSIPYQLIAIIWPIFLAVIGSQNFRKISVDSHWRLYIIGITVILILVIIRAFKSSRQGVTDLTCRSPQPLFHYFSPKFFSKKKMTNDGDERRKKAREHYSEHLKETSEMTFLIEIHNGSV